MRTDANHESRRDLELMKRSQEGDHEAFAELQAIGEARGDSFTSDWSRLMTLLRLKDRVSGRNLLSRAAIEDDLGAIASGLAERSDGPIERLIVGRAALCAVDANLADREHVDSMLDGSSRGAIEAYDRRRDRAHRRLLQTLRTLADVRRSNRAMIQVVVGDGNIVAQKG